MPNPSPKNLIGYLLVIAHSGRMLAQAAVCSGFKVLVIDLFADMDTRQYAADFRKTESLAWADLSSVVEDLFALYPITQLLYGSGFECYPESLVQLQRQFNVCGNTPEVFARVQDKLGFFAALTSFSIPYPEVVFSKPDSNGCWLLKPFEGQGGVGIRHFQADALVDGDCYWQKYQTGVAHSVLFLADGNQVEVVGFNRQWTADLGEAQPFAFAGIINHAELSVNQQALLGHWVVLLSEFFGLRGLNSLDFIVDAEALWVLEINPRIPASMQLYGEDLMRRHIAACAGELQVMPPFAGRYCAYQVVYAPDDVVIPENFCWPSECVDLPEAGVICRKGQPICSIIADYIQPDAVLSQLAQVQQSIFNQLHRGFYPHGIPS